MAQFRQQWDIVVEKKLFVSEWFAQKLELKLKRTLDFSSRKKKCYFLLKNSKLGSSGEQNWSVPVGSL